MENLVESGAAYLEPELEQKKISAEQPDQQDSPEFWEKFGDQISAEIDKRFQSAKDKRWSELEKKYGELAAADVSVLQDVSAPAEADQFNRLQLSLNTFLAASGMLQNPEVFERAAGLSAENPLESLAGLMLDLSRMAAAETQNLKPSLANQVLQGGSGGDSHDLAAAYERRRNQLRPGDINALMDLKREFRRKGLEIF